jgi:hypothetical protein
MKLAAVLALFPICMLAACDDGKPIILNAVATPSPDSSWKATLEEVDNGMGFGLGALYEEVHLTKPDESPSSHGEPSHSAVFYVESTYGKGKGVSLKWLSSQRLQILYDPSHKPGRQLANYRGLSIEVTPYGAATE